MWTKGDWELVGSKLNCSFYFWVSIFFSLMSPNNRGNLFDQFHFERCWKLLLAVWLARTRLIDRKDNALLDSVFWRRWKENQMGNSCFSQLEARNWTFCAKKALNFELIIGGIFVRTQALALVTEKILTDPLDPSDNNFVPMIQHGSVTKHVVSENVSQWLSCIILLNFLLTVLYRNQISLAWIGSEIGQLSQCIVFYLDRLGQFWTIRRRDLR